MFITIFFENVRIWHVFLMRIYSIMLIIPKQEVKWLKHLKSQSEHDDTMVTVSISAEFNRLLIESAQVSGRSKRVEAEMRLKDHLGRFELYLTQELTKERGEKKLENSRYKYRK